MLLGPPHQPLPQLRPPLPSHRVVRRHPQRAAFAHQHDELFSARQRGVEEVPRQHRVMGVGQHHHHRRVFRALGLVDRRRIGRDQAFELVGGVGDLAGVEGDRHEAGALVGRNHIANVAVEDFLLIVILDLHHLVAAGEGAPFAHDRALAGGVQHLA